MIIVKILFIFFLITISSCTYNLATYDKGKKVIEVKQKKLFQVSYYTTPFILGTAGYYQNLIKFSENAKQNRITGAITGLLFGVAYSYLTDQLIFKEKTINYSSSFDKKWMEAYNRTKNTNYNEDFIDKGHLKYLTIEDAIHKNKNIEWYDYWLYENRDLFSLSYFNNNFIDNKIDNEKGDFTVLGNGGLSINLQTEESNLAYNFNMFMETFNLKNQINESQSSYYFGVSFDISYVAQLTDFVEFYNGIGYQYSFFNDFKSDLELNNFNSIYTKHSVFVRPFIDYYIFLTFKKNLYDLDNLNTKWYSIDLGVSYAL